MIPAPFDYVAAESVPHAVDLLGSLDDDAKLLAENPSPTEEEVRTALEGNLCRCTGYHNIVRAVLAAARDGAAGASGAGQDTAADLATSERRSA